MILVMIPLAITELGTDSWITSILTPAMTDLGVNAGWVLVYAMAIVLVLRLFAGPLVHKFSPLGLLAISALIAAVGLWLLSKSASAAMIVLAATVYSFGKAFFWPTSLGVVSEQSPRGGAITLNVVAGIGMLGAGVIGGPLIGQVLDRQMVHGVAQYDAKNNTQLVETLKTERTGIFGDYTAIDPTKRATLAGDEKAAVDAADRESKHDALRTIAILPVIMLARVPGPDPVFPAQRRLQARGARAQEMKGHRGTGTDSGPSPFILRGPMRRAVWTALAILGAPLAGADFPRVLPDLRDRCHADPRRRSRGVRKDSRRR